ncbi:hypothetical protein GG804_12875 [Sphingomonas histidinilytica]|uniref:hypothetical protein n=1 Tax=Rhizorhabdus histidinilytica TaxID=439228 RepID=UPI001ADB703B|nr:hypothetical protein [Rhizorhabdus histidinilytica]MBO9377663.1 hypothetical protein [Rhizorhabdus histidinilytica]
MISALATLAVRVGVPERFARAAVATCAIIALVALLALGKCAYDRRLIARHDAEQEAQLAPAVRSADANAADARLSDQKRNQADEDAERAAVAPLPDARLSDRQRERACAILLRQARERGLEGAPGC